MFPEIKKKNTFKELLGHPDLGIQYCSSIKGIRAPSRDCYFQAEAENAQAEPTTWSASERKEAWWDLGGEGGKGHVGRSAMLRNLKQAA